MFDLGLGSSVSSFSQNVWYPVIDALRDSKIQTFETNAAMFFYDYDGAMKKAFRKMVDETGKQVYSFHVPFAGLDDLSGPTEETRKRAVSRFRSHLPEVDFWGCSIIVVHPSCEIGALEDRENRLKNLRQSMVELESDLRAHHVRMALEFLPRFCMGNSLSDMEKMLKGFDPELFGVCMDVNHLMGQYAIIPDMVRKLGKQLFTLHLSDYDGIDERHWMPGVGVIDWKAFVNALAEIDYRGPFNYEIKIQDGSLPWQVRSMEENYAWQKSLLN